MNDVKYPKLLPPDQRVHLHILPLPFVGVCLHHPEVLRKPRLQDRHERFDADILHQLSNWRNFRHHLRTRNEGKKFPRNPKTPRMNLIEVHLFLWLVRTFSSHHPNE
jgi:hypothetical protein